VCVCVCVCVCLNVSGNVTPGWLTPTAGFAMAAGTGAALGAGEWVSGLFWGSFVAFVVVFPCVLYRLHMHPSIAGDEVHAHTRVCVCVSVCVCLWCLCVSVCVRCKQTMRW
jgi:hypothetical protein